MVLGWKLFCLVWFLPLPPTRHSLICSFGQGICQGFYREYISRGPPSEILSLKPHRGIVDAEAGVFVTVASSVADPGCLYQIPDPDFYPSRIPDPGSRIQKQQQKRGGKIVVIPFVATNIIKLKIILFLKCCRKKFRSIFK
jgi:hypothetical protein